MANYYASQYKKFGFKMCRDLYGQDFVNWFNRKCTFGRK